MNQIIPSVPPETRAAAQRALATYRTVRSHEGSDAEDIVDLITDLAHLADLSDDPDLNGTDVLLEERGIAEDTPGETMLSGAFENYRAENYPSSIRPEG